MILNNPLFFSQLDQNPLLGAMTQQQPTRPLITPPPNANYLPPDAEQEINTQQILASMPQAQQQGPGGILGKVMQNPDAADMIAGLGIGLLSGKDLKSGLALGFQQANEAYAKNQERKIQARKLSLDELKANKPQIQASGVPGYSIAIYPDGRVESIVNDDAVKAYQQQQDRTDARADKRSQDQMNMMDRRLQSQSDLMDKRLAAQEKAAAAKNSKLNPSLQKSEDSDLESIQTANGVVSDVQPVITALKGGKLDLSVGRNAWNASQNFFGKSTPESQSYAELQRTITRITNESLRLNKGTQTEGDAQRAVKELTAAFAANDTALMTKALEDLQNINRRNAQNRASLIDRRRQSQQVEPLFGNQPPITPAVVTNGGTTSSGVKFTIEGN